MQQVASMSEAQNVVGLPVNRDIAFSNAKGVYKKGIERRQRKLLQRVVFLKPFLEPDEQILLTTTGVSPVSLMEQVLTGWIVFYLKRAIFVVTNKRIFHIPSTMSFSYRNSIAEIRYADCETLKISWRTLKASYRNGDKETFLYIPGKERAKLKALLPQFSYQGETSAAKRRTHLCPRCSTRLVQDNYTCPKCRLEFKSRSEALKLSWLFPGGGYFYTRHPFLGLGDAAFEVLLIVIVVDELFALANDVPGAGFAAAFFGVILLIEKVITVYHSNHFIVEYIPKDSEIQPLRSTLE